MKFKINPIKRPPPCWTQLPKQVPIIVPRSHLPSLSGSDPLEDSVFDHAPVLNYKQRKVYDLNLTNYSYSTLPSIATLPNAETRKISRYAVLEF